MKTSLLGSILAALGCSLCCIGPVLLMALGVTSVGLFSFIEPLRPLLTVFALGMLSFTFYQAFRRQPECCAADKQKRKVQRLYLFIMTPVILGFLVFPALIPAVNTSQLTINKHPAATLSEWTVSGMTCQGCANNIQKALGKVKGIINCQVDFASRSMKCATDANLINSESLAELVAKVGYKAALKEDS